MPKVNKFGFTLIELLITIAIIAMLATIGAAIYSGTQGKSRDARRTADLDSISSALESNYDYGTSSYTLSNTLFSIGTIPVDPLTTRRYCFYYAISGTNTFRGTTPVVGGWGPLVCPGIGGGTPVPLNYNQPTINNIAWYKICYLNDDDTKVVCRDNVR